MMDGGTGLQLPVLVQQRLQPGFITNQNIANVRIALECQFGTGNDRIGGIIPAHRINGDRISRRHGFTRLGHDDDIRSDCYLGPEPPNHNNTV